MFVFLIYLVVAQLSTSVHSQTFTVTPFGNSSFRLQITPKLPITPPNNVTTNLPGALIGNGTGSPYAIQPSESMTNENLRIVRTSNNIIQFFNVKSAKLLFALELEFKKSTAVPGLLATSLTTSRADSHAEQTENIYGLGQGNWSRGNGGIGGGCASGNNTEHIVPLLRNNQNVNLLQRKFHISIPFIYSTAGYGLLFNHGGYGQVAVASNGAQTWSQTAALNIDIWVTTTNTAATAPPDIYHHYADATGHAPPLNEKAMLFWQSRNRYKSSRIVEDVAKRYQQLNLPVGVIVVDYKNQNHDGDFDPGQNCFPSLRNLSKTVQQLINASVVFSFWPEVKNTSTQYQPLADLGCLINTDLDGLAFDATQAKCRDYTWKHLLKPNYFDQGIKMYWLDETDAEGTGGK